MAYKKIAIYDSKSKRWTNTLTGKTIKETTAHRYNTTYVNLRKKGIKIEQITLRKLSGNRMKYDSRKKIGEQTAKIKEVSKRKTQVIRTTTAKGKKIIYSPYFKKKISPKIVNAPTKTIICSDVPVWLYRTDKEVSRMYHVIAWQTELVFYEVNDVYVQTIELLPKLDCILENIGKILKKFPLYGKSPHVIGGVKFISSKYKLGTQSTYGYNWVFTRATNTPYMRKQFLHMLNKVKGDFKDGYTIIKVESVYIKIFTNIVTPEMQDWGIRSGVRDL